MDPKKDRGAAVAVSQLCDDVIFVVQLELEKVEPAADAETPRETVLEQCVGIEEIAGVRTDIASVFSVFRY